MPHTRSNLNGFWLSLAISGTVLFLLGATTASAACPPGKETTDGQKPGATAHKGVDEKLLGQIDLGKEKVNLPGRLFACAASSLSLAAKSPGIATRIVRR